MSTEQASDEVSMREWRHAFILLASLELGRVPTWLGPDDLTELRLRVETLALLLALIPRNELGRLDEIVGYLAGTYPTDVTPDITRVRSGIRQLLTGQVESPYGDDQYLERASAVVGRGGFPVAVRGNPPVVSAVVDGQDHNSCLVGLSAWFKQLKTEPEWSRITLLDAEFSIEEVFVEVFTVPDKDVEAGADAESERVRRVAGRITGETHAVVDAPTMIARTSSFCIVVGDPGSGKSTLVQWIAQTVSDKKIADFEAALVVKLGPFAQALDKSIDLELLEYFFRCLGPGVQDPAGAANGLRRAVGEEASCLLLLDGWDEVPVGLRDSVRKRIDRERPFFTTILTSRPSGFPQRLAAGRQTELYHIAGLTRDGRRALAMRYLRAVGRESLLPDLLQQIESNRDLQELACNPFMLALLTWAIDARGVSRTTEWTVAELYGRVVDWIVDATAESDPDHRVQLARSLDGLERLSYGLLFDERMPQYVFSENKLLRELDPNATSAVVRSRFVSRVDSHGSNFAFMHATFEEYFAARHSKALSNHELARLLERAFLSASRGIVLEFIVGMASEAGQTCRAQLDRWMQRCDRYSQVVYRTARLLAACPTKLRPPSLMTSIRSELWNRISGTRDLDIKELGVALFARLDPIALCRSVRADKMPDQYILDCIAETVPAAVGISERIADLMDPALRERVEAELWGGRSPVEIEANRRRLMDPATGEDELRQAILFAGASRDLGAVSALEARLRGSNLPDKLQEEVSTSLGLIGGKEASRALVDLVIGDIQASSVAVGLARRSLQHIEGGRRRLDPAGRDSLLRRIASTRVETVRQIMTLSALQGFPIRTGTGLLKHLAFAASVPNPVRLECLQVLESSLSDTELDDLLQRIEGESGEIEAMLLAAAVQRHRRLPVRWLAHRLRTSARLPDKTMLLTVALAMSTYREMPSADVDKLLAETMLAALSSPAASHADLADAFQSAMADMPVDHRSSPAWIDSDLCRRVLRSFVSRGTDVSAEQVMLAAMLLGRIPKAESGELLRQCLSGCRDRLAQPLTETQVKLLIEVARAIACSLANLDPHALLAFPADWQPVDEVLHTLSNHRGWIVFNDRILDSEGQRVLAPWEVQNDKFDDASGDTALPGHEFASSAELIERHMRDVPPASGPGETGRMDTQQPQVTAQEEKPSGSVTRTYDGAPASPDELGIGRLGEEAIEILEFLVGFRRVGQICQEEGNAGTLSLKKIGLALAESDTKVRDNMTIVSTFFRKYFERFEGLDVPKDDDENLPPAEAEIRKLFERVQGRSFRIYALGWRAWGLTCRYLDRIAPLQQRNT